MANFRSFATVLRPQHASEPVATPAAAHAGPAVATATAPPPSAPAAPEAPRAPVPTLDDPQLASIVRNFSTELVRVRARVSEILESQAELLLADLAKTVLGRELQIAPADLTAIVRQVRAIYGERVMRLRFSPDDLGKLGDIEPAIADPSLQSGDVMVETPDGMLDLRLATRLAAAIDARRVDL